MLHPCFMEYNLALLIFHKNYCCVCHVRNVIPLQNYTFFSQHSSSSTPLWHHLFSGNCPFHFSCWPLLQQHIYQLQQHKNVWSVWYLFTLSKKVLKCTCTDKIQNTGTRRKFESEKFEMDQVTRSIPCGFKLVSRN
jgi:hypothetical protein